ncbi:MAG: AmmeMemoRadiSam system protein B [bacterium]|nr:AmmeMemoRadiSam system protein B [Candidatus Sumerlaeota bacterium]
MSAQDTIQTSGSGRTRDAVVAGLFYPAGAAELSAMIDRYMAEAKPPELKNVRAVICPHAGFVYSGPTAAYSYKLLAGRDIDTVIVLAPSHYADFNGAAVSNATGWRTPLGTMAVSEKAPELAALPPFQFEPKCHVQRPGWWRQSSAKAPPPAQDQPETWEHSAEVQAPFLQKALPSATLLPVIFSQEIDTAAAARSLAKVLDDKTVIVASSDLSHYYPYDEAKKLDNSCVKTICDLDIERMSGQEACGKTPILTVMHLAKQKGWKTKLLDYRNSGDTAGDKSGVVGYAAIAFYEEKPADTQTKSAQETTITDGASNQAAPGGGTADDIQSTPSESGKAAAGPEQTSATLTSDDGKKLLELARKALNEAVTKGSLPEIDPVTLPAKFRELKGCFVTLTEGGELRGCIGHIFPKEPLWHAVLDNARSAALEDPRFPPVRAAELNKIEIEVSVLTAPRPLEFSSPDDLLNKLQPHKDGVVMQIGYRTSTFLPQVWEQLPDKTEFLNHLAQKSGSAPSAWREPGAKIQIYHAEAFK